MTLFRRLYRNGPLHLLAHLALFALAAWVVGNLLDAGGALSILVWFVGAILVHDMLFLPLYVGLDRLAARVLPRGGGRSAPWPIPMINHVRVPVVLSGVLFLVWFPLILGLSADTFAGTAGVRPDGYLERWLVVTGVLVAASGLLYVLRLVALAARGPGGPRPAGR